MGLEMSETRGRGNVIMVKPCSLQLYLSPGRSALLSSALILSSFFLINFNYNYDVCLLRMPQGLSLAIQHHRSVSKRDGPMQRIRCQNWYRAWLSRTV